MRAYPCRPVYIWRRACREPNIDSFSLVQQRFSIQETSFRCQQARICSLCAANFTVLPKLQADSSVHAGEVSEDCQPGAVVNEPPVV